MPLTPTDRKFLKSLRIAADDDIKDPAIYGRCKECFLPLAPFDGRCVNGHIPKPAPRPKRANLFDDSEPNL